MGIEMGREHSKNQQMQGLRGISCLLIMIFHYFVRYQQVYCNNYETNIFFAEFSNIGVFCFFLISGYYLENSVGGGSFLKKRARKLWPKYFIVITMIFILTRFVELPGRTVDFFDYLFNIPLINGFIGIDYVDGAHWFLTTLIACIFWYSIILRSDSKSRLHLYLLWLFLISVLTLLSGFVGGAAGKMVKGILKCLGGNYAAIVILGSLLPHKKKNAEVFIIMGAVFFIVTCSIGLLQGIELITCAILVFCAGNEKIRIFENKCFVFLGEISYSCYLIHQNIGFIIMRSLGNGSYKLWLPLIAIINAIVVGFMIDLAFKNLSLVFDKRKDLS